MEVSTQRQPLTEELLKTRSGYSNFSLPAGFPQGSEDIATPVHTGHYANGCGAAKVEADAQS